MPSPIPPPDSHFISLGTFLKMKDLYSANQQSILAVEYQNKEILPTSETFNLQDILRMQSVAGCAAIRIYSGMSPDLNIHAMIVAVDKDGNDILPNSDATFAMTPPDGPVVIEDSQRCPPRC